MAGGRWLAGSDRTLRSIVFDLEGQASVRGCANVLHADSLVELHDARDTLEADVEGYLVCWDERDQDAGVAGEEVERARLVGLGEHLRCRAASEVGDSLVGVEGSHCCWKGGL